MYVHECMHIDRVLYVPNRSHIYARITEQDWATIGEMQTAIGTGGVLDIISRAKDEYDLRRRRCEERPRKSPRTG